MASIRMDGWLRGRPATRRGKTKSGSPVITVTLRATSPFRAKLANRICLLGAAAGHVVALWETASLEILSPAGASAWTWAAASLGPWIALPFLSKGFRALLARTTFVIFTPERFSVRCFWGWKHFDRAMPHDFSLIPHDRAFRERERLAYWDHKWQRFWWTLPITRYYGESYHLSFNYLGERNDLITVFGRRKALAMQARLKACGDILDGEMGKRDGVATQPHYDWSDLPGDLPPP